MPEWDFARENIAEAVKFMGGLASFYAVIKLRQIERKYLFRATLPDLVANLEEALSKMNEALSKSDDNTAEISRALHYLAADVANAKRKCKGDSLRLSKDMLQSMSSMRASRWFWQQRAPMKLDKRILLDVQGMGWGLVRSLKNDMQDDRWSTR